MSARRSNPPPHPRAPLRASFSRWTSGGEVLGVLSGGGAVSALGALPGEEAEVEIVARGAHRSFVRLTRILRPSPDRREPPCALTQRCGGCPWMHQGEPAQRRAKGELLAELLSQHLPRDVVAKLAPVVPSPLSLGYRRRARFHFVGERTDLALVAWASGSHEPLDVQGCPVTDPGLLDARDHLVSVLNVTALPPWREKDGRGVLRSVVLQSDGQGRVMALLVVAREHFVGEGGQAVPIPWERFAHELLAPPPHPAGLVGVHLNLHPAPGNALVGPTTRHLAGEVQLRLELSGLELEVPADGFSQVNHEAAGLLYHHVVQRVGQGPRLVDVFCGVGAIGLRAAGQFQEVVGIEFHPGAVECARRNAARLGHLHARFIQGDSAEQLRALPPVPGEILVVNPPRKGLGPALVAELLRRRPTRMVYVSCGPRALAEELGQLTRAGWVIEDLTPFDLFPQTPHVETVATLTSRGRP